MKNDGLKNEKAITLIAMVGTIIVLLILAGVSIAVLTGENGILNRATSAKQTNEQKTAEEELKLGVSALSIDYRKNSTNPQTFKEFVTSNSGANLKTAMGLETTNTDLIIENAANGVVSYKGQKYQVNDYGGVAEYVPGWEQTKTSVTKGDVTLEVGQAVTGYSVTANIGGTETTVDNWYVLGAKDGKILLTTNTCPEKVTLSGKDGYTNGVAMLNLAAEKYTNSQLADGSARSINVDDINRVTGYVPDVAQYNAGANVNQWHNDVTYTLKNNEIYYKGTKYPIYAENELGAQSSWTCFEYWNGSAWIKLGEGTNPKSATLKNTYYEYYPNTLTSSTSGNVVGIETDSLAYRLLFDKTNPWDAAPSGFYWIASEYVECGDGNAHLGLRVVRKGGINSNGALWSTHDFPAPHSYVLRPVVTLASDVQVSSTGVITK